MALLGAVLLKKTVFIVAIQRYGFPRLYRRLLEQNRFIVPTVHQKSTASAIKMAFLKPTQILNIIGENDYVRKILSTLSEGRGQYGSIIPKFLVDLSKILLDAASRWKKSLF